MRNNLVTQCLAAAIAAIFTAVPVVAEPVDRPGYFTLGAGWTFAEKDESYLGMQDYELRAGYRPDSQWTLELGVGILPDVRKRNYGAHRPHYQMSDDTSGVRLLGDLMFHPDEQGHANVWDPYVAIGGGVNIYGDQVEEDGKNKWYMDAGFGTFYNIREDLAWFVKPDYRLMVVDDEGQINHLALLSVGYRWGTVARSASLPTQPDQKADAGDAIAASTILATVYFAFDSSELSAPARETLRRNAKTLDDHPNQRVTIEGHCDERGTGEYNVVLGQRRADSVFHYLRGLGVSTDRLRTISYGEEYPVDPGHNEDAWTKNRRVEFKFDGERAVQMDGHTR